MSLFSHSCDYTFRIHIVGERNVGKSSIINYFLSGKCTSPGTTIPTVRTHLIHVNNQRIRLILKEQQIPPRVTDFVIIVCDVSNVNTFKNCNLTAFSNLVTKYMVTRTERTLIIGNKSDLSLSQRQNKFWGTTSRRVIVPLTDGCSEINSIDYIETSSKTGENVKLAFDKIIQKLMDSHARHTNFVSPVLWTKEDCLMFGFCREYEKDNMFIPYDVIQMFLQYSFEPITLANAKITLFDNYVPAAAKINEDEWEIVDATSQNDEIESLMDAIYVLHLCAVKGQIPKGLAISNDIFVLSLNIFLYSNNEWKRKMNMKATNNMYITHHIQEASKSIAVAPIQSLFKCNRMYSNMQRGDRKEILIWFGTLVVMLPAVPMLYAGSGFAQRFNRGLDLVNHTYSTYIRTSLAYIF